MKMAKHTHHQSKATSEAVKLEDIHTKATDNDSSIKLRAYQIHEEKGGSELDNWLEAEQIMMNPTNLLATSDRTGSGGVA
jgi:hypothetical protein